MKIHSHLKQQLHFPKNKFLFLFSKTFLCCASLLCGVFKGAFINSTFIIIINRKLLHFNWFSFANAFSQEHNCEREEEYSFLCSLSCRV